MPKYLDATEKMTYAGQNLAAELYNPAVAAITKWLADGVAGAQVRYGSVSEAVLSIAQTDRYFREEVATETFVCALVPFLRGLDEGRYDPDRGTTVTTYFIGACRNRLGDVLSAHAPHLDQLRDDTDKLVALLQSNDIGYEEVEGVELARRLLLTAPHDLRAILLRHVFDGVTLTESAKKAGLNPATVRSRLLRYKKKLARLHFEGRIVLPEGTALGEWARAETKRTRAVEQVRG